MNYTWWAIQDVPLEALITAVIEPAGWVRDPRWVDVYDFSELPCAAFAVGAFTVVLVHEERAELAAMFAPLGEREIVELTAMQDAEWATVSVRRGSEIVWSARGTPALETVEITGTPPASLAKLLGKTRGVERIPVKIAAQLTGLTIDGGAPDPKPLQIVRFDRAPAAVLTERDDALCPPRITVDHHAVPADAAPITMQVLVGEDAGSEHSGTGGAALDVVAAAPDFTIVTTQPGHMFSVDTRAFPPVFEPLAQAVCAGAASTPWGTLLVATADADDHSLVRELRSDHGQHMYVGLPFSHLGALFRAGDCVVAFPAGWAEGDKVPHLIRALPDGRRVLERVSLPPAKKRDSQPRAGSFGDGSLLISWQDSFYRYASGALAPIAEDFSVEDTGGSLVTLRDGSILTCLDGAIGQIWMDGRTRTFRELSHAHGLAHGPGDAVLVVRAFGDHAITILWTADLEVTPVTRAQLALEASPDLCYFDAVRQLVVYKGQQLHAIAWDALASLPRTPLVATTR